MNEQNEDFTRGFPQMLNFLNQTSIKCQRVLEEINGYFSFCVHLDTEFFNHNYLSFL